MSAWLGFWIFLSVYVWAQHLQFIAGYDTIPFGHKTDAENRLRQAAIKKAEKEAKP